MLQALLHHKLKRCLKKDPATIEDLLTSVVLGTASYMPKRALLPFLSAAKSPEGACLEQDLKGMMVQDVTFWPSWSAFEIDDDDVDDDGPGASVRVPGSQPEVVIELVDADNKRHVLLIEAKLHSGKSSHAGSGAVVTDQLGKYSLHLHKEARLRGATPLGLIYLTTSATMPKDELEATQRELTQKDRERAPLFWLSWRMFADVVETDDDPPMLRDCIKLMRELWGLVYVRMTPFTRPPALPDPWRFQSLKQWSEPPPLPQPWRFQPGADHD